MFESQNKFQSKIRKAVTKRVQLSKAITKQSYLRTVSRSIVLMIV